MLHYFYEMFFNSLCAIYFEKWNSILFLHSIRTLFVQKAAFGYELTSTRLIKSIKIPIFVCVT